MNPVLGIDELEKLELIMQKMLFEAQQGNWQELTRLDSERRLIIGYHTHTDDRNSIIGTTETKQTTGTQHNQNNIKQQASYQAMCEKLKRIDVELNQIVYESRQALIKQTRGIQAQVKAKKGYESTFSA